MQTPVTPVPAERPRKGGSLRFPAFITLALSVTHCAPCGGALIYAAVIDGLERRLDPLPLSAPGLAAAVAAVRKVFVVRPWGHPVAHHATPGHWWVTGLGENFRPLLLAEHVHGAEQLPADVSLSVELLTRFLPPESLPAPDPNDPPPF